MTMSKEQLIDLGETLLKHYKYAVLIYTNATTIAFDSHHNLTPIPIKNIFFNTIEVAFNSLSQIEKNILYLMYFKNEATSISVAYKLFISRSTVYRIRDKALIKIAKFYSEIFSKRS